MEEWYSVGIDGWGPPLDDRDLESMVDAVDALVEKGRVEGPIVSGGGQPRNVGLRVSVLAEGPASAGDQAMAVFEKALAEAGLGDAVKEIAHLEIHTEEALESWLSGPADGYAGVTEVAQLLGVSKQRVSQLRGIPGFPEPVAELAAGPVWLTSTLQRFVQEWPRRPGRPKVKAE